MTRAKLNVARANITPGIAPKRFHFLNQIYRGNATTTT